MVNTAYLSRPSYSTVFVSPQDKVNTDRVNPTLTFVFNQKVGIKARLKQHQGKIDCIPGTYVTNSVHNTIIRHVLYSGKRFTYEVLTGTLYTAIDLAWWALDFNFFLFL